MPLYESTGLLPVSGIEENQKLKIKNKKCGIALQDFILLLICCAALGMAYAILIDSLPQRSRMTQKFCHKKTQGGTKNLDADYADFHRDKKGKYKIRFPQDPQDGEQRCLRHLRQMPFGSDEVR